VHGEREAIENLAVADGDMEVFDFKHGRVRSESMIESQVCSAPSPRLNSDVFD
jgi:hypothetical protein